MRKHGVGVGQRVDGVHHHLFRDAAHFGDQAVERVELPVVGFHGVIMHRESPSAPNPFGNDIPGGM